MSSRIFLARAAFCLAALFSALAAEASVCTWVGPANGGSWDTGANWDCGVAPAVGDGAIINNATVQLGAAIYSPGFVTLQGSASLFGAGSGSTTLNIIGSSMQFGANSSLSGMSVSGPAGTVSANPASAITQFFDVQFETPSGANLTANLQLDPSSVLTNDFNSSVSADVSGTGLFVNNGYIESGVSIGSPLQNSGIMRGAITLTDPGDFMNMCGVAFDAQGPSSPSHALASAEGGSIGDSSMATTITATGTLNVGCGVVVGHTTFNVPLLMNTGATISPGGQNFIDTITVNGNFSQSSNGQLFMDVHGTGAGQFDQLIVTGTATLDGQLISAIDREFFTPTMGSTFNLVTFVSATGTFAIVSDNNNFGVTANYPGFAAQLQVNSSPPMTCTFIPASGNWEIAANWGGDCNQTVVPGPSDYAQISNASVTLPLGTTQVGDIFLDGSTLTGSLNSSSSTLQVLRGGAMSLSAGAAGATISYLTVELTTLTPKDATGAPLNIQQGVLVIQPGSTINFTTIYTTNCDQPYIINNGNVGLYDDVGGGVVAPCQLTNTSTGVISPYSALQISGIFVNQGTLSLTGGSPLTLANPSLFTQSAPTAKITGSFGTLIAATPLTIAGGEIGGTVTFQTPTLNNTGATVRPGGANSIGTITVSGNYVASGTAAHEFEIGKYFDGETRFFQNDAMFIDGSASVFGGSMNVPFITLNQGPTTSADLTQGSSQELIFHTGATGTFSPFTYTPGRTESLNYTASGVFMVSGALAAPSTVVTTTADSGAGSLRAVITAINADSCNNEPYTISFAVGSGVIGIMPQSQLPTLQCQTIIDGTTQPGSIANSLTSSFNGVVNVILNGVNCAGCTGLSLNAASSTVKGLSVINWSDVGIDLGCNASGSSVLGNMIGLDAGGNPHGNGYGVMVENGASNVLIGDSTASGTNIISGNTSIGVFVDGASTNTVIIGGNLIGVGVNGTTSIGNGNSGYGVQIKDAQGIQVGNSTIDGGGAGPAGKGVAVVGSAEGASILNTGISNVSIGIDLGNDGPTLNDVADADTGPNGLQNYPTITSVTYLAGGSTTVAGTLSSGKTTPYRIEVFSNPVYSTNTQGKMPSGQVVSSTDGTGTATWSIVGGSLLNVSATATDTTFNDTSEFAPMHQTPFSYVAPTAFNTPVNVPQTRTVTFTNLTSGPITAGTPTFQSGVQFSVTANTCTSAVAAGTNCTITVQFLSSVANSFTDTMSVLVKAASNPQIVSDAIYQFPLSATGTGASTTTLSLSTASLNFNTVVVGTPATTQAITVTNTGTTVNLNVTAVSISGAAAGDYTVTANTCMASVTPDNSCTITVGFTPSAIGARAGLITITANVVSPATVSLSGNGVGKPVVTLAITPSVLVTGATAVGTITIANPNATPLTANGFTFTHIPGVTAAATPNATSTCVGANVTTTATTVVQTGSFTIPANGSCAFSENVTAATVGTYSGSVPAGLIVTPYGSNLVSNTVTLTVVSPNTPGITFNPTSLSFGSQGVGTTSASQAVVVTSSGNAALSISQIGGSGDFGYLSDCPLAPQTLAPQATCKINVTFKPLVVGTDSAFIYVTDNAPNGPHPLGVSGQGIQVPLPAINANPNSLIFGDQVVGSSSATQIVTVTNPGTGTLAMSNIAVSGAGFLRTTVAPAGVTVPSCGTSLAPQTSCFIGIVFAPGATGTVTGDIAITHNVAPTTTAPIGNPLHVALTGNGTPVPRPVIQINGSLSFGDLVIGNTSAAQPITITNGGTAVLAVNTITLGGANASEFVVAGNCTGSLNPGASCALSVTFKPLTVGAKAAQVTVASNAQNTPSAVVNLTANGVPVPAPVMQLGATTLGFGNVIYGSFFGQSVSFTNSGTAPLQILGVDETGNTDFSVLQSCGTSLAPGARCSLSVTFTPHAIGARAGTINIRSNADGSPHHIPLTGTGCRYFSPAAARFFLTSC